MKVRIDKLISNNLNISRKEAKRLLNDSAVTVNGTVCNNGEFKVDTDIDNVTANGKDLNCSSHIYIMMNKPQGVVSASEDGRDKTVVDLVPDELRRKGLFPAGRLDKDTVGFVLITDDGDFAHRILSPRNHVEKTYVAKIERNLTDSEIKAFSDGITLGDGTKCLSAKVGMIGECEAEIKIVEGRYHQVKRMFASLGNKVLFLKRVSIGNLVLDSSLSEGECRALEKNELDLITEKCKKM